MGSGARKARQVPLLEVSHISLVLVGTLCQWFANLDIAHSRLRLEPWDHLVDGHQRGLVHGRPCKQLFHRLLRQLQKQCGKSTGPRHYMGGK